MSRSVGVDPANCVPSVGHRVGRALLVALGLLAVGVAAGFVGRLLWPRRQH